MTPLFLNGVNGTSVIDNKFKSDNSLFSTYSGVFDFSKGSRKGRSIELDYALTAYTKTLFPTMVSSLLNATLYYGYYNFNLYNNMYVVNMSPSKLSVDGSGSMLSVITLLLIPIALSLMLPIFIDSFSLDRSSGLMEFISLVSLIHYCLTYRFTVWCQCCRTCHSEIPLLLWNLRNLCMLTNCSWIGLPK